MENTIVVSPLGWLARAANVLMTPIMEWVSETPEEELQQTHPWNYHQLTPEQTERLNYQLFIRCPELPNRKPKQGARFHMPRFGGWREYVVLSTPYQGSWHIGWIAFDDEKKTRRGISRIPLRGGVRMLLGPETLFFGLSWATNLPIRLREEGRGIIGDDGPFAKLPLL